MKNIRSLSFRTHAASTQGGAGGQTTIGPETIHRVRTANDITILVRPNPSAPVAMLEGCLRAGSVDESV